MEELGFPAIAIDDQIDSPDHFAAAASLWLEQRVGGDGRRSFASVDFDAGGRVIPGDEERMDKLWESFNEELCRLSGNDQKPEAEAKLCGAALRALSEPRASRGIVPRRRPGLVLILKVLKKLFLMHQQRPIRRAIPLCS